MRTAGAVALAVALMLVDAGIAGAQNYPWCAVYRRDGRNCGFVSWEQCMATVRVNNGFCEQNFHYRPEENRPVRRKARRPQR
jgi:hypothetical protein